LALRGGSLVGLNSNGSIAMKLVLLVGITMKYCRAQLEQIDYEKACSSGRGVCTLAASRCIERDAPQSTRFSMVVVILLCKMLKV
jgi:hypothetical protein